MLHDKQEAARERKQPETRDGLKYMASAAYFPSYLIAGLMDWTIIFTTAK